MIPEQNNFNSTFKFNKIFFGWFIVATMVTVTFAQTALYNPALSVFLKLAIFVSRTQKKVHDILFYRKKRNSPMDQIGSYDTPS